MYDLIYIGKRMKEADNSPRDQRSVVYLEVIAKLLFNLAEWVDETKRSVKKIGNKG